MSVINDEVFKIEVDSSLNLRKLGHGIVIQTQVRILKKIWYTKLII